MDYNELAQQVYKYTTTIGSQYLKSGHKIRWIKGCREVTNMSLRDAKAFCDLICDHHRPVDSHIRIAWENAVNVLDAEGLFPQFGVSFQDQLVNFIHELIQIDALNSAVIKDLASNLNISEAKVSNFLALVEENYYINNTK